jgi:hypothetical protein
VAGKCQNGDAGRGVVKLDAWNMGCPVVLLVGDRVWMAASWAVWSAPKRRGRELLGVNAIRGRREFSKCWDSRP